MAAVRIRQQLACVLYERQNKDEVGEGWSGVARGAGERRERLRQRGRSHRHPSTDIPSVISSSWRSTRTPQTHRSTWRFCSRWLACRRPQSVRNAGSYKAPTVECTPAPKHGVQTPTPSHRTLQTGQGSPPKASRRRSADERSCCAPMERRKRHAMRSKAQAKTCEQQHTQKKQSVKQLSKWLRPIVPHDGRRHKSQASPSPRLSDRRSTPRSAEP